VPRSWHTGGMAVQVAERWWHPAKDFPLCPGCRQDFPGLRPTPEVWQEVLLGGGWTVALRLAVQGGHPVVAELRVFPAEPGPRDAGRWSVETLGVAEAARFIPPGGLTARKLREVKVTEALTGALPELGRFVEWTRDAYVGAGDPGDPTGVTGMESAARAGARRGRNREAQTSDRDLAQVAGIYERLAADPRTSRAVSRALASVLAKELPHLASPGDPLRAAQRARQLTHAARRRKLLTGGGKGRSGGALTPKARALLAGRTDTQQHREPDRKGSRP